MSEGASYALSLAKALRIIADFIEAVGQAEREGLRISEVLRGTTLQPAQWGAFQGNMREAN